MTRMVPFVLAGLLGLLGPPVVHADQFTIDLTARAGKDPKAVTAAFPTPNPKPAARAILTTSPNTPITVKWSVKNTDPAATAKDVLVHFFVVKQAEPNQQEVPKLTKHVAAESALTMDFRPQDKADGEITFTIPQPGCYLIRVELKGAGGKAEPFTALDLVSR